MICYESSPLLRVPPSECVGRQRVIRLTGFAPRSVARFRWELQKAVDHGQPLIPIVLDSYGGDACGMFSVVDLIDAARIHAKIATVVEGKAMSAAALILSCGDKGLRYVGPNAVVMVHEGIAFMGGKITDLRAHIEEQARQTKKYFGLLDKNSGQKEGFFEGLSHKLGNADAFLDPETAVKVGLADAVGLPQMRLSVGVEISFGVPEVDAPKKPQRAKRAKKRVTK